MKFFIFSFNRSFLPSPRFFHSWQDFLIFCTAFHSCLSEVLWWMRSSRVVRERLAVNAKVATVMGSIPASPDTVESEGQQMKQCWVTYIKRKNKKNPPLGVIRILTQLERRRYWYPTWASFLYEIPGILKKKFSCLQICVWTLRHEEEEQQKAHPHLPCTCQDAAR